ncbi:MAG: aspartate--tRNA ligase [Patescibacteria group bacterium]
MERIFNEETIKHIGKEVRVAGWVNIRRDHGKLIFIDLRDKTGIVQIVVSPDIKAMAYEQAKTIRSQFVVEVKGMISKRPTSMINPGISTGAIEIKATDIFVLNESETPPFDLFGDGKEINEEIRLQYKYLDLIRPRLQKNLRYRHLINQFLRDYLTKRGFTEIETPYLSKSTPEGARDFIVPSRLQPNKFYALPQSPQQYKQLLMVAGVERYFQIVRCFRDEDNRTNRQPEFTQLDLEMSFIEKQEEVLDLIEDLYTKLVKNLFPEKKITKSPFIRMTYREAITKYKSDKPDLRIDKNNPNELAFAFIVDFPMFEEKEDGSLDAVHHPFTLPKLKEDHPFSKDNPYDYNHSRPAGETLRGILERNDKKELLSLEAFQYDLVCNGYEIGGGSIRTYEPTTLKLVFEALGHKSKEVDNQFGHILKAFKYGVPPHGGIALGLDRFVAILMGEPNIREVMAFPKSGDNRDLMMEAPSEVSKEQLKELHLKIVKKKIKRE